MQKRSLNLDVIRSIAVLSVLSIHFFLFTDFYSTPLSGKTMYIAMLLRTCFMICVPLFLILSGYLMNKKTISIEYFKGISKVLSIYVLACIPILLFRIFYLHEALSIGAIVRSVLAFDIYAWYIEMYIGLYLIIPFVNILYNNLEDKKQKTLWVAMLIILSAIPSLSFVFGFNIPDFWTNIYPLTYYFIGVYLREFSEDIKLSASKLFAIFLLIIFIGGTYFYMHFHNNFFSENALSNWGGLVNTCSTTVLFLFLLKCDFSKVPSFLSKIIETISLVSLPLYLVSWIFDTIVYNAFNARILNFVDKVKFFPITVLLSFIGSFTLAYIINSIYTCIKKIRTSK